MTGTGIGTAEITMITVAGIMTRITTGGIGTGIMMTVADTMTGIGAAIETATEIETVTEIETAGTAKTVTGIAIVMMLCGQDGSLDVKEYCAALAFAAAGCRGTTD